MCGDWEVAEGGKKDEGGRMKDEGGKPSASEIPGKWRMKVSAAGEL